MRSHNEDVYGARPDLGLFIVADGMGGHAAGEVAACMVVWIMEDVLERHIGRGETPSADVLREALSIANRKVYEHARQEPEQSNMGSTATVLLIQEDRYAIGHVGDSRIYRFRDDQMERLTHDHSFVQWLVDQGALAPEETKTHPHRNVITRAVGTDPTVEVDMATGHVQSGDVFLLCSDGLSGVVDDERIGGVIQERENLDQACRTLLRHARRAGGPDNITAVIVEIP